jgi:hypothetical protein
MFEDLWSDQSGLKNIWDFLGLKKAKIDNWVFRLHYYATCVTSHRSAQLLISDCRTLLFVGYSALVTMNTYAGDPIGGRPLLSRAGRPPLPRLRA